MKDKEASRYYFSHCYKAIKMFLSGQINCISIILSLKSWFYPINIIIIDEMNKDTFKYAFFVVGLYYLLDLYNNDVRPVTREGWNFTNTRNKIA